MNGIPCPASQEPRLPEFDSSPSGPDTWNRKRPQAPEAHVGKLVGCDCAGRSSVRPWAGSRDPRPARPHQRFPDMSQPGFRGCLERLCSVGGAECKARTASRDAPPPAETPMSRLFHLHVDDRPDLFRVDARWIIENLEYHRESRVLTILL
jgi:hypothetical protein